MESIFEKSLGEIMGVCLAKLKQIMKNKSIILVIFLAMPLLVKFYELSCFINDFMSGLIIINLILLVIAVVLDIKVFKREADWKLYIISIMIIVSCYLNLKTSIFMPKGLLYEDYNRLYQEIYNKDYNLKYYITLILDPQNKVVFFRYFITTISIYGIMFNFALFFLNLIKIGDMNGNDIDNNYSINNFKKIVYINMKRLIILLPVFYILGSSAVMETILYRLLPEYFIK